MQQPLGLRVSTDEPDLMVKEACARATYAGYDGVELRLGADVPRKPVDARPWFDGQLAEVAAADAAVLAIGVDCPSTALGEAIELVRALLRGAAACQARCLNVAIPPLRRCASVASLLEPCWTEEYPPASEFTVPDFAFAGYQDALNFAYHLLRETRYEAESTGVPLALEAACGGCLLSPVELRETIDAANSWALGVCLDTEKVASMGSPADWLATLNRRVRCIRLRGSASLAPSHPVSGVSPDRQPSPGLTELFGMMEDTSYDGPIIMVGTRGSDPPEVEGSHVPWSG